MTILAVDNENLMLNRLCRHITQIKPDSLVVSFKNPADALAYMENHTVDVVFLEMMLQKMMGIELARQMQQINPHVNIIFTSSYSNYIYEAMSEIRCSGFIVNPVTNEKIKRELEDLRHPIECKALY